MSIKYLNNKNNYNVIIVFEVILIDEAVNFMINKEWEKDYKFKRKKYLLTIATECEKSNKDSDIIGGILIYNQLIEQLLKESIICSISYIKAEIWPINVQLDIDFEKATFGTLIDYFKKFTIKEHNYDIIINYLKDIKKIRNNIVHNLFNIPKIEDLKDISKNYYNISNKLVKLLNTYYEQLCYRLYELSERVEWDLFKEK